MKSVRHINWTNSLFLILTPLVAIIGTVSIVLAGALSMKTVWLGLILLIVSSLSITGGYHRLFSHGSYQASWIVRVFFALFGAANFEGSILEWCTDHRDHHRYTDTEKDPYNFKQGFWYAHIGWLFTLDQSRRDFSNVDDLQQDWIVKLQHQYFVFVAAFMGFIFPLLIAMTWGDALGGFVIAGALRITLAQQFTFCINSVCHAFGTQPFSDRNTAKDNWFTALFTFGEGYHNFHHKFPIDYRNGVRFYDYDPTKWLIWLMSKVGLANKLKTVGEYQIIRYRMDMDKKHLQSLAATDSDCKPIKAVQNLHQKLTQALSHLGEMEKAYKDLIASKDKYMQDRMNEYRKLVTDYCTQLTQAKSEVKKLLKNWSQILKTYPVIADHNLTA